MMTNEELQELVQIISRSSFQKPFKHEAVFNKRLRTTGGRYHLKDHHIDINPKVLTEGSKELLVSVIKHELCHYHLHLAQLDYRHQSQDFKQLLAAVGGIRYTPPLKNNYRYVYECHKCHCQYFRVKRVDLNRYVCGKCAGQLQLISHK